MSLDNRGHHSARARAKFIDPDEAYRELVGELAQAYVRAGTPGLDHLSQAVGYPNNQLAGVLTGTTMPSWPLVERLGTQLGTPEPLINQHWLELWTAANRSRRRPTPTTPTTQWRRRNDTPGRHALDAPRPDLR